MNCTNCNGILASVHNADVMLVAPDAENVSCTISISKCMECGYLEVLDLDDGQSFNLGDVRRAYGQLDKIVSRVEDKLGVVSQNTTKFGIPVGRLFHEFYKVGKFLSWINK